MQLQGFDCLNLRPWYMSHYPMPELANRNCLLIVLAKRNQQDCFLRVYTIEYEQQVDMLCPK